MFLCIFLSIIVLPENLDILRLLFGQKVFEMINIPLTVKLRFTFSNNMHSTMIHSHVL